jgi:cell division protein FtsB
MSRRLLLAAAILAVLYFAVQGGEYSTTDLFRQRGRERSLRSAIDSLTRDIDSLRTFHRQLQNDPMVQERVARERYGLVRGDKEIVYRFTDTVPPKP